VLLWPPAAEALRAILRILAHVTRATEFDVLSARSTRHRSFVTLARAVAPHSAYGAQRRAAQLDSPQLVSAAHRRLLRGSKCGVRQLWPPRTRAGFPGARRRSCAPLIWLRSGSWTASRGRRHRRARLWGRLRATRRVAKGDFDGADGGSEDLSFWPDAGRAQKRRTVPI